MIASVCIRSLVTKSRGWIYLAWNWWLLIARLLVIAFKLLLWKRASWPEKLFLAAVKSKELVALHPALSLDRLNSKRALCLNVINNITLLTTFFKN